MRLERKSNMDLWIRSQDRKRLGKIELIEYEKDDYGYYLFGWWDKYNGSRLATYKSEERALEVLDEIEDLMRSLCDSNLKMIRYEMPKE